MTIGYTGTVTNETELRIATNDDFTALAELIPAAFLQDHADDELEPLRMVFEADRTHVVADAGTLVGTGATLAALAAGGLVTERTPGTVHAASVALSWHRSPGPVEIF